MEIWVGDRFSVQILYSAMFKDRTLFVNSFIKELYFNNFSGK